MKSFDWVGLMIIFLAIALISWIIGGFVGGVFAGISGLLFFSCWIIAEYKNTQGGIEKEMNK